MAKTHSVNFSTIKRALLSVSDKIGIVGLASALIKLDIEILSTGGTASLLRQHQIPVVDVSEFTGFPEIMDGRVKTLHPKIAGGILGRRTIDAEKMRQYNIQPIDLIVVNLYPFAKIIANPNHSLEEAIENIDIGGPSMIRAAAKNYTDVAVVVDPNDYSFIIDELMEHNGISKETRFNLMKKAFQYTAQYDNLICSYFNKKNTELSFPVHLHLSLEKKQDLRYGENPHQQAALYVNTYHNQPNANVAAAKQLQGKSLSFNNIVDADTAFECVKSFEKCACVIVKHANPCGVAIGETSLTAYQKAFKTDPTSAFGGIIAFNQSVDESVSECILEQQFVEVVIAPEFSQQALAIFSKKKNIRLLETGYEKSNLTEYDIKHISSGLLIQSQDNKIISEKDLTIIAKRQPSSAEINDLLFAWNVAKFVKSNAIVYAKNQMTIGIGAGQMSRIYSAKIAQIKAADENLEINGSVMASDAFFPFRDSIDAAANAGITAIIQPGGSIRDEEVINAANEHNIAMAFTGIRHFRH